jgi:Tfp pilus assembly protein PilO
MAEKKVNTAEYIKIIKESPEKQRSYIFFGFSLVVAILLILFAIRPTVTTISRINKEMKEKARINTLLEQKINTLNNLDKEYAANREAFDALKLVCPADNNFSLFLSNIEAITARNGFSLSSVKFDKYRGKEYSLNTTVLVPHSVSFTIRGRQVNIIALLRDLEELPMYPVVESLSYSTQEGLDGLSSFSISLRIYRIENDNFYN